MPPVQPIEVNATTIDLSKRIVDTTAIVASPALAAETIIASLALPDFGAVAITQKIYLRGWAAYLVGTSGAAVQFRVRKTNVSGAVVADTGALTGGVAAGKLLENEVAGSDVTPGVGVYVLTMQVTSGGAESTVSAVQLFALIV